MKLKNNWTKYRHSADPKDLSIFRKFQWHAIMEIIQIYGVKYM